MADDRERRVVDKLILLMQASCDPGLKGKSHVATLAVVLDACYDDTRCRIGPTSIGRIAGLHDRTVRECLDQLEAAGYIRTERRSARSEWIYPNLDHAAENPRLVTYEDDQLRVHRPANESTMKRHVAGPQARYGNRSRNLVAGPQATVSGPVGAKERVHRPTDTVFETIQETEAPLISFEEQQKQRQQEKRERIRSQYLEARSSDPRFARFMEKEPTLRTHIEDLIGDGREEPPIDAAA